MKNNAINGNEVTPLINLIKWTLYRQIARTDMSQVSAILVHYKKQKQKRARKNIMLTIGSENG